MITKKKKKETALFLKDKPHRQATSGQYQSMVATDQDALYTFFKAVPKEDARYLRDDVVSRLIIEKWANNLDYDKTLPILALKK
jgi:hypothetical protein